MGRKEPTSSQKVLEVISSQKLTGKCNRVNVITTHRDKDIIRTNLQENRCIFNPIRHIQAIGKNIISLPTKPPTPDHIVYVVNIPLVSEWYDSIFSNCEIMATSTTFSAPFLRSLLPPDTKITRPRISVWLKTTDIDNQYDIYSRTCKDGSSMIEGVDFTVYYAPAAVILSLHITTAIASAEDLIIFVLDIYNAFQNTILPNPEKIVYLSLPYIYLNWYIKKWPKHPLASSNQS